MCYINKVLLTSLLPGSGGLQSSLGGAGHGRTHISSILTTQKNTYTRTHKLVSLYRWGLFFFVDLSLNWPPHACIAKCCIFKGNSGIFFYFLWLCLCVGSQTSWGEELNCQMISCEHKLWWQLLMLREWWVYFCTCLIKDYWGGKIKRVNCTRVSCFLFCMTKQTASCSTSVTILIFIHELT